MYQIIFQNYCPYVLSHAKEKYIWSCCVFLVIGYTNLNLKSKLRGDFQAEVKVNVECKRNYKGKLNKTLSVTGCQQSKKSGTTLKFQNRLLMMEVPSGSS